MRLRKESGWQRRANNFANGVKLADRGGEHFADRFDGELAFVAGKDAAIGIEKHQGWPSPNPVALPNRQAGVVDNGVSDLIALDRGAEVGGLFLSRKFSGMDTDDDQLVWEDALELPRPREDMEAIDSAIGPKVENDQFPTQIGEGQRRRIEPVEPGRKFRSADRTGIEGCHGNLLVKASDRIVVVSHEVGSNAPRLVRGVGP